MTTVRALNADQDQIIQALDQAREDALAGRMNALVLVAATRGENGRPEVASSVCLGHGASYTELIGGIETLKAELLACDSQVRSALQEPPEDQ